MCVPILRSIGTKLTNLENMQNRMFYLTSRDAKTVRRTSWRLGDFRLKVMAQTVVFMIFVTLTLTVDLFFVSRIRHEVLESPCEVSSESVNG